MQRPARVAGAAHDGSEGRGLDRVADRGAGAVQLDVLDLAGLDARALVGALQHVLLRRTARSGEGVVAAVVDGAALDDAVDVVAVGQRAGQRLEEHGSAALAPHVAVRPAVEGVAAAVGGQSAPARGEFGGLGQDAEVDTAHDGGVGLAVAQALAREVDGHQ